MKRTKRIRRTVGPHTPDQDKDKDKDKMDDGDENSKKTTARKAKRDRSPHKELFPQISPAKKRGRKLKSTAKNPNPSEHLPPRYRTTRHIHAGKHINHGTNRKKNKICVDCKLMEVEE